ncbi:protein-tyrosine-phosphatase [Capnocytophaga stomatis]|nr:protein-tyrosine-phosphatase [Capnocytophaga stomatis]
MMKIKLNLSIAFFLCFLSLFSQNQVELISAEANLYKMDDKLYRSEQLREEDKQTIEKTPIKTIINLRYFTRSGNRKVFNKGSDMTLINIPLLTWRIKAKDIANVLSNIKKHQQKGAVLVHCYHGADRTGIMVAMYRVIYHNWSIEQAKKEMQQGPFGYHSVWRNLDRLLTERTVNEVKKILGVN